MIIQPVYVGGQGYGGHGPNVCRISIKVPDPSFPRALTGYDFLRINRAAIGTWKAENHAEADTRKAPGAELKWVEDLYSYVARQDPDQAIDLLFAHVDDWLSAGLFHHCDSLLRILDTGRLDTNLLVATLSITRRAKTHLPGRESFVHRVQRRLNELAPERAERLLDGLI